MFEHYFISLYADIRLCIVVPGTIPRAKRRLEALGHHYLLDMYQEKPKGAVLSMQQDNGIR